MTRHTLNGQFLEDLTDVQKGQLWQYYRLLKTPSTSIDDEVEQVTSIWKLAEGDPILCKWLELVDYFYANIPESDEQLDDNRRSHFSEHLETLLEQKFDPDPEKKHNGSIPDEAEFLVFICPDNSGYVRVPIEDKDSITLAALSQQVCGQCKMKLVDHEITYVGGFAPKQG